MVMVVVKPWPMVTCERCQGLGVIGSYERRCPTCWGTGDVPGDHTSFPIMETATTAELLVLRKPTDKAVL